VTAFPGPRLRRLIDRHSLFRQAREQGLDATFANAYSRGYLEAVQRGERRPSVTTCAVWAAELSLRGTEELRRGEAVTWDMERDRVNARLGTDFPRVTARQAGRQLAALAASHHLTVFETFLTDLAGHGRFGLTARDALSRVDGLLAGVLERLAPSVTLILSSDHGNLEDAASRSHTRNPVPLLACGPLAPSFADLTSIVEVTPRIVEVLKLPS
jgi:2,3-bisphosphoglycerate-independent phosphoglycerate mutase